MSNDPYATFLPIEYLVDDLNQQADQAIDDLIAVYDMGRFHASLSGVSIDRSGACRATVDARLDGGRVRIPLEITVDLEGHETVGRVIKQVLRALGSLASQVS